MVLLLLLVYFLIAESTAGLIIPDDTEFNSTTECRNSLTDNISITISCTLPLYHRATFFINGLSMYQMVNEIFINYTCHDNMENNCVTNTTTTLTGTISASSISSCSYTVTCFASGFVKEKSFILKDCILLPTRLCDTNNDVVNVTYYNNVTIVETFTFVSSIPVTNIIVETTTVVSSVPVVKPTTVVSLVTVTNVIPTSIFETETLNCSKTTTMPIATSTKAAASTSYCAYTSTETFTTTEVLCLPSSSSPSITVTADVPVVSASAVGAAGASAAGLVIVALVLTVVFFFVILQCRKRGNNGPNNNNLSVQNPNYIAEGLHEPRESSTVASVNVQNVSSNHYVT